ncbi:SirB1 family protein [Pelagibius sp. Alg239-R121]|uniref:SirB1 family protein n=1 Tax=Pelagibius sp. Alg239-R121 TaxID=2993448 RepID=UPI0024A6C562|nr:transglutaminase-like domain-containing protein [Pelagibius sp. Alg239-R121]
MNWSPASGRKDLEASLRRIGGQADDEIDLAEAALFLAALDRPRVSLDRYRHHLTVLARDTKQAFENRTQEDSLSARMEALKAVIFDQHAYRGDSLNYDDLQNANLMRVIDRQKGLPVALGILYIHCARAQGWKIEGLNFPGHFLLRMDAGDDRSIVDPFHGGAERSTAELRAMLKAIGGPEAELRPEHYRPAENRMVLKRLQDNIKVRLLRQHQIREALEVVETMLMFAPAEANLWREAGILHADQENLRAAILALEQCLSLSTSPNARHEAAALLQQLKSNLN